MMNIKPIPAIALLIIFSLLVWVVLGSSSESIEPETTFEFSTAPTTEYSMWLESDSIPPPCIFFNDGENTIRYLPEPNEPNEPIYSPIYDRALSAEEIAEIDRKLSEPNEPEEKLYDPTTDIFYIIDEPNEPTFEYQETNGVPICPYCQKPTRRGGGCGSVTLVYYEPIYDANGTNTNPDRNTETSGWTCHKCGNSYSVLGNAYDGYNYCGEYTKNITEPNEPNWQPSSDKSVDVMINEPNEPNEPEWGFFSIANPNWEYSTCSECGARIHISEAHWCPKQILRYIPTWPDYIELEKDLVILHPKYEVEPGVYLTDVNCVRLFEYQPKDILPKGTKIYFKEDEE